MIYQSDTLPERRVQAIHLPIVKDQSYLGVDLQLTTDLDLLVSWWKAARWLDLTDNMSFKTRALREFDCAVWVRINELHPKTLLRFKDLE